MKARPPLTQEAKQEIRKMIREELRAIEEEQSELEQRVHAAAMEDITDNYGSP